MNIKPDQRSNNSAKQLDTPSTLWRLRTIFLRNRLTTLYNELLEKDGSVILEKLRERFLGIEEKRHTILSLFDKKIAFPRSFPFRLKDRIVLKKELLLSLLKTFAK